jgi:hypothetical protein
MWGFTVDDALISVRYARHLAAGLGWRFDAGGPSTDGVTPLPWPLLLLPLARGEPLLVLAHAKALGLLAWGAAGAGLGDAFGRVEGAPRWARAAALAALALSVPVAAHAVSGMETSVAMALATGAVLRARRPVAAAGLAGLAAALRPEMAPWAAVVAVGLTWLARRSAVHVVLAGVTALAPFAACALVRLVAWGRPAPLALMAKPSDAEHGLVYVGAACVVTLVPVLVVAPVALRRSPVALVIVLAAAAHLLAIVAVGGDWMPYARLVVPIVPSLAWAALLLSVRAHPAATAARAVLALGAGLFFVLRGGTDGRRVGADRAALVAAAAPALASSHRVAALDAGWVGAATDGDVIDLAGVTDPEIAALPGGHTSKHVDGQLLLERDADSLLLYAPSGLPGGALGSWRDAVYTRALEARLASDPVVAAHFSPAAWLPLGPRGAGYVLLRRERE